MVHGRLRRAGLLTPRSVRLAGLHRHGRVPRLAGIRAGGGAAR
jgi:hypothetical protein